MTPIRRRRDPLARAQLGVYRRPCVICGRPVPAKQDRCEAGCQPRVVKAAKEDK